MEPASEETMRQALAALLEIRTVLRQMAESKGGGGAPLEVRVGSADGAIQELVNKVLDEILRRVKSENILSVTNG